MELTTREQNLGLLDRLAAPRVICHDKRGTKLVQTAVGKKGPIGYVESLDGQRSDEALLDQHVRMMDVLWIEDQVALVDGDRFLAIPDPTPNSDLLAAEAEFALALQELEAMTPEDQALLAPEVEAVRAALRAAQR